jgi:hypothetical protein
VIVARLLGRILGDNLSPRRQVCRLQLIWIAFGVPTVAAFAAGVTWPVVLLLLLFVGLTIKYFGIDGPHCGRFPYFLITLSYAKCYRCGAKFR